jgi:hypothetical protein
MNKKYLETLLSSILILVMILTPVYSVFAIGNQDDNRSESQKGATGEPADVASYPLKLANEELSPQAPSIEIQPWQYKEIIELKFVEGSSFRLVEGTLTAQQPDDLIGINGIFETYSISRIERLFSQPEQEIEAERAELQSSAGEPLPDLNLWYRIWVPEGSDPQILIDALNALPEVQTAYAAPLPAPPPTIDLASSIFDPVTPPSHPQLPKLSALSQCRPYRD